MAAPFDFTTEKDQFGKKIYQLNFLKIYECSKKKSFFPRLF